jgi:hypothetical protein
VCNSNCELFSPIKWAAPAAPIQSFVNGAIGTRLPSCACRIKAYNADPVCVATRKMVVDPGKICKEALNAIHFAYRHALRQSHIVIEDNMLILHKLIRGSASYTQLQIVPVRLWGILFVAFHSNPIGGHLNVYHTLHRLRMHYYWPEMYSYVKRTCHTCPGCALLNPPCGSSLELIYHFPIEAPFRVLFVDAYSAGKYSGFEGSEVYLIAACGMTGFSAMESIQHANLTTFASGIMKIQLHFGFCHTIILNKDSNFLENSRKLWTYYK